MFLERLRRVSGEPLALDRVWLPAAQTAGLREADFSHTSLYDELATRCGIRLSGGQEHIRAAIGTAAERRRLQVGPDVALLAIDRLACTGDAPIE